MQLFIEVTDIQTGRPALVGLPHIRLVRQDEEGRAIIWLTDPPDENPLLVEEPYVDILAALTKRAR
jgi:hypothetical protein